MPSQAEVRRAKAKAKKIFLQGAALVCQDPDSKAGFKLLGKAAEKGNVSAQLIVGDQHLNGQGGAPKSRAKAIHWYSKCATNPHVDENDSPADTKAIAQYNAGLLLSYQNTLADPGLQNFERAVEWLTLSAEWGYAPAQTTLGAMLGRGQGISQNNKTALDWHLKAVKQGHVDAQFNAANCYRDGTGTKKDEAKAAKLYRLAIAQGDEPSKRSLKLMLSGGAAMDAEGIMGTELRLVEEAAEKGDAVAQNEMGSRYLTGRSGCPEDKETALEWFERAAAQEDSTGMLNVAMTTFMLQKDPARAMFNLEKASAMGNSFAKAGLAQMNHGMTALGGDAIATAKADKQASAAFHALGKEQREQQSLGQERHGCATAEESFLHNLRLERECHACGKKEDSDTQLKICLGCRLVRYCSVECADGHWKSHKADCRREKADRERRAAGGTERPVGTLVDILKKTNAMAADLAHARASGAGTSSDGAGTSE